MQETSADRIPRQLAVVRQAYPLRPALYDELAQLAILAIAEGQTQTGADVLAFLRRQADLPATVRDMVDEHWEDLATWACPRVLLDAETEAQVPVEALLARLSA